MKLNEAVQYFGTQAKMAQAVGVTDSAVTKWKRTGIVPLKSALLIKEISAGEVDLRLRDYH